MHSLGEEGELIETIQQLSLARSVEHIQAIVRHTARRLTGADGATFVLRDGDLCHYADEDAIAPLWKGQRFPMSACISGWVMLNREAAMLPDIYADDRIPADAYRPTFVKSLLMVPIRKLDPIGAIGNYWAERHEPSDREVMLLQALADSTAMAMENVRMIAELEAARRDSLMRLAIAAEYRDDGTHQHPQRVGRTAHGARGGAGHGRQPGVADRAGRGAARRRQARHPGRDPAQAQQAGRPRVREAQDAHHRGRRDPERRPFAADGAGRADRPHPPRALGRLGVPQRPDGRRHPHHGADRRPRRRLRRPHPPAPLQAGVEHRRRRLGDPLARGPAVRPRGGRRVHGARPGRA